MPHKPIHWIWVQNKLSDEAIDVKWINLISIDIVFQYEFVSHSHSTLCLPLSFSLCVSPWLWSILCGMRVFLVLFLYMPHAYNGKQIISLRPWNYGNKYVIQSHCNSFILIDWFQFCSSPVCRSAATFYSIHSLYWINIYVCVMNTFYTVHKVLYSILHLSYGIYTPNWRPFIVKIHLNCQTNDWLTLRNGKLIFRVSCTNALQI